MWRLLRMGALPVFFAPSFVTEPKVTCPPPRHPEGAQTGPRAGQAPPGFQLPGASVLAFWGVPFSAPCVACHQPAPASTFPVQLHLVSAHISSLFFDFSRWCCLLLLPVHFLPC